MKIKNGRVRIECEKDRTKFSEVKYREFLAHEGASKKKTAKKGVSVQAHAACKNGAISATK